MTSGDVAPLRGQAWWVELRGIGRKPLLVVSNNRRNRALREVVTVRVTTAPGPRIPSIATIPDGEPLQGSVRCDDIVIVPKERLLELAGGFSTRAMDRVDAALRAALALD